MEQQEKVNKLIMHEDLEEQDRSFLEGCQLAFDSLDSLTCEEEIEIDRLYSIYFIDYEKAKKENKSLGDFGK